MEAVSKIIHKRLRGSNYSDSSEEEINLYFKIDQIISLTVKRSQTIGNVKALIQEKVGIPENFQEHFFTGDRLKDDQTLLDYGIRNNSTVRIILQKLIKVAINILLRQKTIVVEAKSDATIQNVKNLIQEKEGIYSNHYTLFYDGKLLEDNMTLASLGIEGSSTFHLMFNPQDSLSVFVKMPTSQIKKLQVKVLYTVGDVKALLESIVGISFHNCDLHYQGKKLEDSRTLSSYNVQEESTLEMLRSRIQIFIKTWNSKTIVMDVKQHDTARDLKVKIAQQLNIPIYAQCLVYSGKILEDKRDLASYNIEKHSTVHLFPPVRTKFRQVKLSQIGITASLLTLTTTVSNLKAMIQRCLHEPVKELFHQGQALEDKLLLVDCVINVKSVVGLFEQSAKKMVYFCRSRCMDSFFFLTFK